MPPLAACAILVDGTGEALASGDGSDRALADLVAKARADSRYVDTKTAAGILVLGFAAELLTAKPTASIFDTVVTTVILVTILGSWSYMVDMLKHNITSIGD